jgi:hypothetical protein
MTSFNITCSVTYGFQSDSSSAVAWAEVVDSHGRALAHTLDPVGYPHTYFPSYGVATYLKAVLYHETVPLDSACAALHGMAVSELFAKAADMETAITLQGGFSSDLNVASAGQGGEPRPGYLCVVLIYVSCDDDSKCIAMASLEEDLEDKIAETVALPPGNDLSVIVTTTAIDGSCYDGLKGPLEAGVDCGEEACSNLCVSGQTCSANTDCESFLCDNGQCSEKTTGISVFATLAMVTMATMLS